MSNTKNNIIDWIENIYLNYKIYISIIISVVVTTLYHFKFIKNIKGNISNMIDLTAALLVVITLILTLLLYLNDKEEYKKKMEFYKEGNQHIYYFILKITITNILSTLILIIIGILETQLYIIKLIFSLLGTYCFSYMMLGTMFMLWFTIYIVVGLNKKSNRRQRMS